MNTELERRVRERTAELTAANQELEAFTYSVAHDLRAPLRHIDAFTKIIFDDFAAEIPSEARRYLENIRKGSQNMSRLVDDLLNLARVGRQELKYEQTPLNPVVDEVIAELRRETANRHVEWRIGRLPVVESDPGLVKQVFANLLSNAVKYTRPRSDTVIEIGQRRIDGHSVIFVRDNGVGFNMKYADKLFGVFQRLHRADEFEGTGVGLATVERIVRKHGGRIWAESEVDRGATFYFTLNGLDEAASSSNGHGKAGDPLHH
jgi:light-regulated signal transduction histidine kinase (bacteriophytochrome)